MRKLSTCLLALFSIGIILTAGCDDKFSAIENSDNTALAPIFTPPGGGEPNLGSGDGVIDILGVWHCSNDGCAWGSERDTAGTFDTNNHWIIDRGDGKPSVNLVVLSFVNPLKLLNETTDSQTLNGVPKGMTQSVIEYFKNRGIRVMLSIGGITYSDEWETVLNTNPRILATHAAEVAGNLGVGIEIDFETNDPAFYDSLNSFITAYREIIPYDATGQDHAARFTIDLSAGTRWLTDLSKRAATDWLDPANPVLDYANAMVPNKQPRDSTNATGNWQEHIAGYLTNTPIHPARLTGSFYIIARNRPPAECIDFLSSLQRATDGYVDNVKLNSDAGTAGMQGFMFWASGVPASSWTSTTPPNTCENGLGGAAQAFNVPIPMQPLRQQ